MPQKIGLLYMGATGKFITTGDGSMYLVISPDLARTIFGSDTAVYSLELHVKKRYVFLSQITSLSELEKDLKASMDYNNCVVVLQVGNVSDLTPISHCSTQGE